MQCSAIVNRFFVKTYLNSAFTNDLKRKEKISKNVHSCRLSLFKLRVLKPLNRDKYMIFYNFAVAQNTVNKSVSKMFTEVVYACIYVVSTTIYKYKFAAKCSKNEARRRKHLYSLCINLISPSFLSHSFSDWFSPLSDYYI